jgi:hypothetical protein
MKVLWMHLYQKRLTGLLNSGVGEFSRRITFADGKTFIKNSPAANLINFRSKHFALPLQQL